MIAEAGGTWLLSALLWCAPVAPLAACGWLLLDRSGRIGLLVAAAAVLPALVLAVWGRNGAVEASWLLLGAHLEVDDLGRSFLLLTALLWGLAALFAHGYLREGRRLFTAFWLLTLSGNLALVLAGDVITFYLGFVVMTFAGYGLVVHERTREALRAGRVYVVMAMLGEAALLAGVIAAVWASTGALQFAELRAGLVESEHRTLIVGLLLGGFGVKAGVAGLHMWLPLAHPAAPVPASAVLSGVMIKAGVLGWIRFVPIEEVGAVATVAPLASWGTTLVVLGVLGAFLAVLAGLPHRDPKVTLAYSSVSQVGVLTMAIGMGLLAPGGTGVVAAVAFYALHHGLAKGALFLGIPLAASRGVTRRIVLGGLALSAVAIAAGPMTSGMVAKGLFKSAASEAGGSGEFFAALLPVTSIATTVLMARYLWLVSQAEAASHAPRRSSAVAWGAVVTLVVLLPWVAPPSWLAGADPWGAVYAGALFEAAWPLVAGGVLAALGMRMVRQVGQAGRSWGGVPAGDLIVPVAAALRAAAAAWHAWAPRSLEAGAAVGAGSRRLFVLVLAGDAAEGSLGGWTSAAAVFVLLVGLFVVLGGW
jgi:hydrogenase-4 component B